MAERCIPQKTIGVLGGMGPLATADFFTKLVQNTAAASDEEHLLVLIDSDPRIPSRREAILHNGPSPVPALRAAAQRLISLGAQLLVMPCNTAHHFYPELAGDLPVPFLHMPRLAVEALQRRGIKRACLLATDMTLQSGVYHEIFHASGLELVLPSPKGQRSLMDGIFRGIKGGQTVDCSPLFTELQQLYQSGAAEIFLLACTELPLLCARWNPDIPTLDSTLILARAAIFEAGGTLTEA